MSHYNISVEMKDRQSLPKNWISVIRKVLACFDCETVLQKTGFSLYCNVDWHDYFADFESAVRDGFVTRDLVAFWRITLLQKQKPQTTCGLGNFITICAFSLIISFVPPGSCVAGR